ncbi:MAG: 2-phospho-L-lactate transferase CofD family protein [Nocardioidaceae bacterium]
MLTVVCGGYGAARFLPGLVAANDDELCCVVNTGDDLRYLGMHVSPDLDSVCYALAGMFDEERGWGVGGDTFRCNTALARYGDDWFHIGDADLALHLKRSALLAEGLTLTAATEVLTQAWGLPARVLPMTDGRVRTVLDTDAGLLGLQEYVVARAGQPEVRRVMYEGAHSASPAAGVLPALRDADVVLFAPQQPGEQHRTGPRPRRGARHPRGPYEAHRGGDTGRPRPATRQPAGAATRHRTGQAHGSPGPSPPPPCGRRLLRGPPGRVRARHQ